MVVIMVADSTNIRINHKFDFVNSYLMLATLLLNEQDIKCYHVLYFHRKKWEDEW